MRRLCFVLSLCLLLPLTTVPAFAQESMGASATEGNEQPATPAKSDNTKPQIITDEKTNTVRILIGGKEVVTIDAKGLHIKGDIDYSGTSTDTGG